MESNTDNDSKIAIKLSMLALILSFVTFIGATSISVYANYIARIDIQVSNRPYVVGRNYFNTNLKKQLPYIVATQSINAPAKLTLTCTAFYTKSGEEKFLEINKNPMIIAEGSESSKSNNDIYNYLDCVMITGNCFNKKAVGLKRVIYMEYEDLNFPENQYWYEKVDTITAEIIWSLVSENYGEGKKY